MTAGGASRTRVARIFPTFPTDFSVRRNVDASRLPMTTPGGLLWPRECVLVSTAPAKALRLTEASSFVPRAVRRL
jgi:hypothetical protein